MAINTTLITDYHDSVPVQLPIIGNYDTVTVMLSVIIAIFAAYVALDLIARLYGSPKDKRPHLLTLATFAMGLGIWSMHFVGMLAYQLPFQVYYDLNTTLVSIGPALLACGLAFFTVTRNSASGFRLLIAAVLMGIAIASMHYLGMMAMRMPAVMSYRPGLFTLSILIAIGASFGALHLAMHAYHRGHDRELLKQLSAILMGFAISGMHYVGMAAIQLHSNTQPAIVPPGSFDLARYDWIFALLIFGFLVIAFFRGIQQSQMQQGFGLSAKITAMTSLLVLIASSTIGILAYNNTREITISIELNKIDKKLAREIRHITQKIEKLVDDVRYIQHHPKAEILIEHLSKGGLLDEHHTRPLLETFQDLLNIRGDYAQVRLIGILDNGKELLRVDRTVNGVVVIPGAALQDKSQEPYYRNALARHTDNLYLSQVTLNREHGRIDPNPPTWMLRAVATLRDKQGRRIAFVIINMDLNGLFNEITQAISNETKEFYITDETGRILIQKTKGSISQIRSDSTTIQQRLPGLLPVFQPQPEEILSESYEMVEDGQVIDLHKAYFDPALPGRFLAITEIFHIADIERGITPSLKHLIRMTILLIILTAWPAVVLTRLVVSPLKQITQAAIRLSSGNPPERLDMQRGDEVGVLARSFFEMSNRVLQRERALRASERLTNQVIEAAGDGIIIINTQGIMLTVNAVASNMFGYQQAEMEGQNVSMLIPEPHRSRHDGYLRDYFKSVGSGAIGRVREVTAMRCNGDLFPLELVVTEAKHDESILLVGMLRDITQRKQAEQELRLSGQVMASSLESIVVTDADCNICQVNPAFTEIFGYTADEVIGKNPRIFSSGRHDKTFFKAMWDSINENGTWRGEIWDRRKNGEIFPKWLSISAITDRTGIITHYVGISSDITERKLSEMRLEELAHYDPLTRLPNRILLQDRLKQAIAASYRSSSKLALMFLDLDRFKIINDTHGHAVGDKLLFEASQRLKSSLRDIDTLARQGGDEFVVVLSGLYDTQDAGKVAEGLINALTNPFYLDQHECFIGASIGIAIFPDDATTPEELSRKADSAMYEAKSQGGNSYAFFDNTLGEQISRRITIEHQLRYAIDRNELVFLYQPIVSASTEELVSVEALLRWHNAELGQISPTEFIPLAEETGIINDITFWGLEQILRQYRHWRDQGINLQHISINISPRCILKRQFPELLKQLIQQHQIPPHAIELELTENTMMEHSASAPYFFDAIDALHLNLAIDDFGTGYSSLAYIKQLPVNTLKIDRSFIQDIESDKSDREIIKGVIAMAHGLDLKVVAEGVEHKAQLDFLRELGCDLIQGWYYLPALTPEAIQARFGNTLKVDPA